MPVSYGRTDKRTYGYGEIARVPFLPFWPRTLKEKSMNTTLKKQNREPGVTDIAHVPVSRSCNGRATSLVELIISGERRFMSADRKWGDEAWDSLPLGKKIINTILLNYFRDGTVYSVKRWLLRVGLMKYRFTTPLAAESFVDTNDSAASGQVPYRYVQHFCSDKEKSFSLYMECYCDGTCSGKRYYCLKDERRHLSHGPRRFTEPEAAPDSRGTGTLTWIRFIQEEKLEKQRRFFNETHNELFRRRVLHNSNEPFETRARQQDTACCGALPAVRHGGKEKGKEADHRKHGMMTLEKWQVRRGAEWRKIGQSGKIGGGLCRLANRSSENHQKTNF
ncbi:hypothetical protein EVAR_555_1 [Eumeta japonica]|uniref:Uncharacterized protein n=1 Tax=Eumeta variegata TaxID=151549 RepID=A0A4C1SAU1_EUMVA|nr:hypothetical protein EVAR_555_1 [Eumeta japonica]